MSYQPSSKFRAEKLWVGTSFERQEWDFLVRLPGRVVLAATLAGVDGVQPGVPEGLAGVDAIAAGYSSTNRLVRDVVVAIYDETDDRADYGDQHGSLVTIGTTLIACRSATALLARRVARRDSQVYRHWLAAIAERVCHAAHAAPAGAPAGPAGGLVDAEQRRFLAALRTALDV
jgi:hypothetical protein